MSQTEFVIQQAAPGGYFARTPADDLCLLMQTNDERFPSGRSAGGITLEFHRRVSFSVEGASFFSNAAILTCKDSALEPTFRTLSLDIASRAIAEQSPASTAKILQELSAWEALLRSVRRLTPEEELGLWGELYTILLNDNVPGAVQAWVGPDNGPVDFLGGGVGLEVKTTRNRLRHSFSHRQTTGQDGVRPTFVLSIWAGDDHSTGETVDELIKRILACAIDEPLFESRLLRLGYLRSSSPPNGMRLSALESPKWFAVESIPKVRSFDPGIIDIRYTASLDPDVALSNVAGLKVLNSLAGTPIAHELEARD